MFSWSSKWMGVTLDSMPMNRLFDSGMPLDNKNKTEMNSEYKFLTKIVETRSKEQSSHSQTLTSSDYTTTV